MDVETHALSSYDLNSNPPFSFSNSPSPSSSTCIDHPELRSQMLRISDSTSSFGSAPLESPVVTRERVDIVDRMDWGCISNGLPPTPPATKRRECEGSVVSGEESVIGRKGEKCSLNAAMKVQKVYRSYRTRRMLADSAVVAEELWWQAIDYARLNHSTISFFNFSKPETAAHRWNRIILNASKVGKGLSKDGKAQKLAFQHWIEAIDPRHRYGHGLHLYYEEWCKADSGQPFFYWLDLGDGKDVDLPEFPRSKLRKQCIKYLGPQEREHYEYIVVDGKILHKQTGNFFDTTKGSPGAKWIFVMSTSKRLYAGEKRKGIFHHSSFLAGGATIAAGRLAVKDGVLQSISAYSGHYRPTEDSLDSFLQFLKDNGVNLDTVEIKKPTEESEGYEDPRPGKADNSTPDVSSVPDSEMNLPIEENKDMNLEATELREADAKPEYQRTLSGGLRSPKADVPKTAILQRINSKKTVKSYQLGHQLSRRWSTGAGPRIGCVADYPMELRVQALELTNLSPKRGLIAPIDGQEAHNIEGMMSPFTSQEI